MMSSPEASLTGRLGPIGAGNAAWTDEALAGIGEHTAEVGFVLILERGGLEPKAILLAESIRRFGGPLATSPIWAIQPRSGGLPSTRTMRRLTQLNVVFVHADLNRSWRAYGPGNKPYAAAYAEGLLEGRVRSVVLLDTDVVLLQPPLELLLMQGHSFAACPVDEAHLGSPWGRDLDEYWSFVYRLCGITDSMSWPVESTVDGRSIRAYFNAGMVVVRPEAGIFRRWREAVEAVAGSPGRARILSSKSRRWFLDQVTLAATVLRCLRREDVRILPTTYNYPVHKQHFLPREHKSISLAEIVIAHYHHSFHGRQWMETFEIQEPHRSWLKSRLPLPGFRGRLRCVAGNLRRKVGQTVPS